MIYVVVFLLSFSLTYLVRKIALKKSLLAEVNERSSHTVPTPHGGGIAVALSWFIGLVYLYLNDAVTQELFFALLAGSFISIVSFLDDMYELSAKLRLGVQVLVSACGLYLLGGLDQINLIYFSITNPIITNGLALFMMVWFINLYNFLDGIDGYAGSEAVFLGIAGFLLFGDEIFLIFLFSASGFLILNWQKAKIFMGDVGSTLLGYNVAIFTLYFKSEGSSIMVWLILFGLFWFDATLTLIRRYKNGEKLTQAHKKHAYQRLTQAGWSHQKVVLYSIGANFILLALVYTVSNILTAFFISLLFLYLIMGYIDKQKAFA